MKIKTVIGSHAFAIVCEIRTNTVILRVPPPLTIASAAIDLAPMVKSVLDPISLSSLPLFFLSEHVPKQAKTIPARVPTASDVKQ
jgi:hypothetical protein